MATFRRRELLVFCSSLALVRCGKPLLDCPARTAAPADALAEVVSVLEDTPKDRVFDAVARKLKAGLEPRLLLGGVLIAGTRNLPGLIGGAYHAVMMVDALAKLSAELEPATAIHPHFAGVGTFSRAYDTQRRLLCWELGVEPESLPASEDAAAAFRTAVDAGDAALADRAATTLYRVAPRAAVVDALLVTGTRRVRYLGHESILAAKGVSAIDQVGWDLGLPLVRAMAQGVCNTQIAAQGVDAGPDSAPLLAANEARAAALPLGWETTGTESTQASLDLLAALRTGSADGAAEEVARLLGLQVSVKSIWDGITLAGAECALRFGEAHGHTAVNAVRHSAALASSESVRRLMLLQAAARVPLMRESYFRRGMTEADVHLDALEPAPTSSPGEVLGTTDRVTRVRRAFSLLSSPDQEGPLRDALREKLVRSGHEEHQWKHPAAALEDANLVHPDFRRALVAMMAFDPPRNATESDFHRDAVEALARA